MTCKTLVVVLGFVSFGVACAEETALWPSAETAMRAQPDSTVTPLKDGAIAVRTGVKYPWPGVRMDFMAGVRDLSSYGKLAIVVSNTTDRPVTCACR